MVREVNPPSRKSYDATSATRVKIGPIRACRAESESFAPTPCRWPSHAGEEQQAKPGRARLLCGVPVSGLDLASLLQGEEGFFLCQNRGQNYITVAKAGHSIAFGPMPIGRIIQEEPSINLEPEPWFVTKISNSTEFADFRGTSGASAANR
jgi:hypothetical protein